MDLVDVSDIFNFFLLREGEGGVRGARRGAFNFLLKILGGGSPGWSGAGRVSAANWGTGGGAKYVFFGPRCPPRGVHKPGRGPHANRPLLWWGHCWSNFGQALEILGNEASWCWHPWDQRADAHGPRWFKKNCSETGRVRFRRARFRTPNSVSFFGPHQVPGGGNSVSSSQPSICVPKRSHRGFPRTHRVCCRSQWVLSSETVLSKQYSARFLNCSEKLQAAFASKESADQPSRPWQNLSPTSWSTWRPADQPTSRLSTWTWGFCAENHTRNSCGLACCGLVCGSPCGSLMWVANVAMAW